jgi:hypothetical protein
MYKFTTQRSSTARQEQTRGSLVISAENFIDFEQGLDWSFRVVEHEYKRQTI